MLFSYAFFLSSLSPVPQYEVLNKVVIGGDGGWDTLTMDSPTHRLFISRGTHVMVLDVEAEKLVGDIPNTPGVHGIALAPAAGKGYTSNGRDNSLTVFDYKTLKEITKIKVGTNPDVIFFDSSTKRVYSFNGGSNDVSVVDPKTDTVVGTVKLDGKPEFGQIDGSTLFVNIEDKSKIQKVDLKTLKVAGEWSVAPGEEPTGLAMDVKNHLLFSACGNNICAISDLKNGKVVAAPKIGRGPDGAEFDSKFGVALIPNGQDGTLTVIARDTKGTFSPVQTVKTQTSARTMALDPKTHRAYLIAAEYQAQTDGNNRRRQMVPGSAAILVVGPKK